MPQTLTAGATYTCASDERATGDPRTPHVNTVTGTAVDNENNEVIDTGDATVRVADVVPKLGVDKSVSPSQLPEPGGEVTYSVVVTNPQDASKAST